MKAERPLSSQAAAALARGNALATQGNFAGAAKAYLAGTESDHVPAALCLALARAYLRLNNTPEAVRWAAAVVDAGDDFPSCLAAATLIRNSNAANAISVRGRLLFACLVRFTTRQP